MATQRLDKFLATQGGLTRAAAKQAIRAGQALVDGVPARDPAQKIDPLSQEIILDGARVVYREFLYLMLHKPAGVLTATTDRTRQTVLDLVPPPFRRPGLSPVGRLDRDTTGLLLLTDDGDFAHRLISPKSGVEKCYLATVDADLDASLPARFAAGVTLADGTRCRPAGLEIVSPRLARITVCEGKYHQIKRMLGAVGYGVDALHRIRVGGLELPPDLAPGSCRLLTEKDRKNAEKPGFYEF